MGSRSPKSNQHFSPSQWYICVSFAKICPFNKETECEQEATPPPPGSRHRIKNNMSPPPPPHMVGGHKYLFDTPPCDDHTYMNNADSDWPVYVQSDHAKHVQRFFVRRLQTVSTTSTIPKYLDALTSYNKVKPQWLKHLWDHGNLFETWVKSSQWGLIMASGQEANDDNLGIFFSSSRQ